MRQIRLPIRILLFLAALLAIWSCSKSPQLPPLGTGDVILAFGDSLTHGTGAGREESYPAVLAKLTGRRVVNAGVPGEVSEAGLKRLPGLLEEHDPALVILCHGGNDFLRKRDKAKAENNIRAMISLAKQSGAAVVLVGVPEPGLFLSASELYERVAESTGALYLADIIPDVLSEAGMKSDTVHPNAKGYRAIAEHIHAALREAGAL